MLDGVGEPALRECDCDFVLDSCPGSIVAWLVSLPSQDLDLLYPLGGSGTNIWTTTSVGAAREERGQHRPRFLKYSRGWMELRSWGDEAVPRSFKGCRLR